VATQTLSLLTNHGRALLCIARDPEIRLRDIADDLGITERHAYAIVMGLAEAGYILKEKKGRRNRYQVQNRPVLSEVPEREQLFEELLEVLRGRATRWKSAPRVSRRPN
jgi:DNA-binding MarR family transcriptional regulator